MLLNAYCGLREQPNHLGSGGCQLIAGTTNYFTSDRTNSELLVTNWSANGLPSAGVTLPIHAQLR